MNSKLKIMVLQRESLVAPYVQSLSVEARITEVLDYLKFHNELDYITISENDEIALQGIKWADALILSKHSSGNVVAIVKAARDKGIKIIYDIDDLIFSFPKYSGGNGNKNFNAIKEILSFCDVVTVANSVLLSKLKSFQNHLVLLPNGIWIEKYIKPTHENEGLEAFPPRIVFTNADFIKLNSAKETLLTALQVFFVNHDEYILDFYGDPFPEIFSLPFLNFTNRMPYENYMSSLAAGKYSFAITPLGGAEDIEEQDFNSCKNPFKYLNYGATLVPGIYSRATIYEETIADGKTGILVNNDFRSWLDALELLASNRELRNSIRKEAYQDVFANYHIKKSAEVLMRILG